MTVLEEFKPRHHIAIDTLFWQHRSPFAGSQQQLDELRADADRRAGLRFHAELARLLREAQPSVFEAHRPAVRRLKAIIHVGLIPMLWAITTCTCGHRWPCNAVKQHLRSTLGWTVDITGHLKTLTEQLPKPANRWRTLKQVLRNSRHRIRTREFRTNRPHGLDVY